MEEKTMTAKETIEIISNSSLWKTLSIKERIEAATYAIEVAGITLGDDDVSDLIGEVYAGWINPLFLKLESVSYRLGSFNTRCLCKVSGITELWHDILWFYSAGT